MYTENSNKIGDLTTSTNTNKTSVVGITNEINASLSDIVCNIKNYSGNSDGTTDNITAFNNAKSVSKGKVIFFPQNVTGNALYYFSTSPDFSGYKITADKGVKLSLPTTNNTSFKTTFFDGNVSIISRDRNNSILMPSLADEHIFLADMQDISSQYKFTNVTDITLAKIITNSHVYTTITPTDETYDYLVNEIATDLTWTFFNELVNTPEVGKEYFCYIDGYYDHPNAYTGFIIDDSVNIRYVYFDTARNLVIITNIKATDTYATAINATLPTGIQTQNKSSIMLSIQVVSANLIKLFVNGVYLTKITCNAISKVGFCFNGYCVSNAKAYGKDGVRIGKITSSNIVPKNGRELNIAVFGDSISFGEGTDFSWSEYALPRMIKGKYGISKVSINNQAISGCTLHDQRYYFLTMPNLSNYDYVLVLLGTNDIAVQSNLATFRTDIDMFVSTCATAGVPLIFGLPPLAIDSTDSGYGYQMANIHLGAPYRYAFMQAVANNPNNTYLADVLSEMGIITGQNEILRDNVHPTHKGAMLIGRSFAKTILNLEKDNSFQ